jgi:hypothetical protein
VYYQIDLSIKEKFVSSIKNGLYETQSKYSNYKRINNAKHFVKMDDIANSVIDAFESNPDFNVIIFPRGPYKLVLVYDTVNDILYSLMSTKRFQGLLDRKDHSHVHYLDALVNFNDKLEIDRHQLVIDDNFFEPNVEKINQIKDSLTMQLNGIQPGKYLTITFGMDGFRLLSVEAILTSEYLEVADREDWSELIEIDYSDLVYEDIEDNDDFDELDISIKPHITRNDDILEEHITPKIDKKENQS